MSCYIVPDDAMESAALMAPWVEHAWGAALRAASKSIKKTKKKTP